MDEWNPIMATARRGVRIAIGEIAAKCPACGASEFEALMKTALGFRDVLRCANCGQHVERAQLTLQIAEEGLRKSTEFLRSMK